MTEPIASPSAASPHRTIWRWHFYAGLFCIPFIIWLSVTGAIYLFKPQFEAWQDKPYDHLEVTGPAATAQAQVAAALAAVPGGTLKGYELPTSPQAAVRVWVTHGADQLRVYVHPQTLQILQVQDNDARFMEIMHELHGNFKLGNRGSYVVELAASWAIVMIISGIYLWWPRNASGIGGVLYPRLNRGGRQFWRDLHAVIGLWVSGFALFLLVSGLPWAHFWGQNLKAVRQLGNATPVQQDWPTGKAPPADGNTAEAAAGAADEHAEHHMHDMQHMDGHSMADMVTDQYAPLDRLVPTVAQLNLVPPVQIRPPSPKSAQWTAQSLSQDRTTRVALVLDGDTGAILRRKDFADKKLFDKIVNVGVSIHEGQFFGWFNQLLGVLTAFGLITIGISGYAMWWKRRPAGVLGAPKPLKASRVTWPLIGLTVIAGILLPMLGISIIAVLLIEHWVLRRIPQTREFLGLQAAA